jgi:indole-3-glycerol phosphate synthase
MTILDEIVAYKRNEVEKRKAVSSTNLLEKSNYFGNKPYSLREALLKSDASGIIAEFKRKSPSKGMINDGASVEHVTKGYVKAGASALSVLTDEKFFGGSDNDLSIARKSNSCPVLRKDFIVDEYQILEAKSLGADVILLIAACLTKSEVIRFSSLAKSLQLEILLELHEEKEIDSIIGEVDLIGINNRNLKNFKVDLKQSIRMAENIPISFIKVAESGIDTPETISELRKYGFKGFLMGERFMREKQPEKACAEFIKHLQIREGK